MDERRKLKRRKAMKFLPSASLLVLEVHHQVLLLLLPPLLRAALALLLPTRSSAQGHGNQRNAESFPGR